MDTGLLCCLGTRRLQAQTQRRHGGSGEGEASTGFLRATCGCCAARHRHGAARLKTPTPRRWMRGMNLVFARSPSCDLTTATTVDQVGGEEEDEHGSAVDRELSREHVAAVTIQACFRRHLAKRAFRALRSLVKMQAFARGSYVRKQVDVAILCMKVLVRLQVRVRARQLLDLSKYQ